VGIWNFDYPALLVRDPALVHQVLVTNFQDFPDNEMEADPHIDPVLAKNLFVQRGVQWKRSRQILSPAFTVAKAKATYSSILSCADKLSDYISRQKGDIQVSSLNLLIIY